MPRTSLGPQTAGLLNPYENVAQQGVQASTWQNVHQAYPQLVPLPQEICSVALTPQNVSQVSLHSPNSIVDSWPVNSQRIVINTAVGQKRRVTRVGGKNEGQDKRNRSWL